MNDLRRELAPISSEAWSAIDEECKITLKLTLAARKVQPLVEFRAPFKLSRGELETIARAAKDADLQPVTAAVRAIAIAEDRAVFHGYPAAGIEGICDAARGGALSLTEDYERYPGVVAAALAKLRTAGVDGPYAIALGPKCYTGLRRTTSGDSR